MKSKILLFLFSILLFISCEPIPKEPEKTYRDYSKVAKLIKTTSNDGLVDQTFDEGATTVITNYDTWEIEGHQYIRVNDTKGSGAWGAHDGNCTHPNHKGLFTESAYVAPPEGHQQLHPYDSSIKQTDFIHMVLVEQDSGRVIVRTITKDGNELKTDITKYFQSVTSMRLAPMN